MFDLLYYCIIISNYLFIIDYFLLNLCFYKRYIPVFNYLYHDVIAS